MKTKCRKPLVAAIASILTVGCGMGPITLPDIDQNPAADAGADRRVSVGEPARIKYCCIHHDKSCLVAGRFRILAPACSCVPPALAVAVHTAHSCIVTREQSQEGSRR